MNRAFSGISNKKEYWIRFLPFLLLYSIIVLILQKKQLEGDEGRYIMYAENLLHGYYSPKNEVFIWNGPGYPILLMPFLILKTSWTVIRLLNALMIYISVVTLFKTLVLFVSERKAYLFAIVWALYYIMFREMSKILTESFVIFLLVLLQYHIAVLFFEEKMHKKHVFIAGCLLGWIILTKIIFSYIMMAGIITGIFLWLIKQKIIAKKIITITSIAFLINLPYLVYTHHVTNRYLYWANSGGSSLYWASTPFKGEYGDWNSDDFTAYCGWDTITPCNATFFAKNHEADFILFRQLKGVEKDDALKKKAIENIKAYPLKYAFNCLANIGRMLFGMPQSYSFQRPNQLILLLPNIPVVAFILFDIIFLFKRKFRVPVVLLILLIFTIFYLCLSIIVSAEQRQFYIVVPFILLLTAYCLEQAELQIIQDRKII
jgi:hypothetical protein